MSQNNLQKQIKILNNLLNRKNFYNDLCIFSDNDIDELISNISKIITYYLSSNDKTIYDNLSELFKKINANPQLEIDYKIYPTNNFYYRSLKVSGINPAFDIFRVLSSGLERNMERLENEVSFYPISQNRDREFSFFTNVKEALEYGSLEPQILFKGILKQPLNIEQPIIVGNSETSYYQSILKERLGNLHTISYQTGANIGKKCISSFVGQDILLTFFPKSLLTNSHSIKPSSLSFIKIPSKYTLLQLCAKNKRVENRSEINMQTGKKMIEHASMEEPMFYIRYSRYERITITDELEYFNCDLTGDINYDIDLIYGRLDSNNSREKISPSFQENLANIKKGNDISLRKIGNRYIISNGRHRILYLKHFYVNHFQSYKNQNRIE